MHKETVELFSAKWMSRLNIAPFALEADLLDLSKEFRAKLRTSLLTNGWSPDQFMVIATSEDAKLHGQPIQGRQRIIEISSILKDGKKFDISKILIRYEPVSNVDQLRAKRASYEASASLAKDPKISRKWVDSNLRPIVKNRVSSGQTSILKYLNKCGFHNDNVSREIIEDVMDSLERKAAKKERRAESGQQSTLPAGLSDRGNWGLEAPQEPGAKAYDDSSTTYFREIDHTCEHCGKEVTLPLNIAVGDDRKLVKVELVKVPIER